MAILNHAQIMHDIQAQLAISPMTSRQLQAALNLKEEAVNRNVRRLREANRVHIARYVKYKSADAPEYALVQQPRSTPPQIALPPEPPQTEG